MLTRKIAWLRAAMLLAGAAPLFAHPMGNFSINHYAKLRIAERSVEIRYLIDMAEIPAFQEMRQFDIGPQTGSAGIAQYVDREWAQLKSGVVLQSDGRAIPLELVSRRLDFSEGAGGLSTMKFTFVLRGKTDGAPGAHRLTWRDDNFPDRAGWKEVVAQADGVAIAENSAASQDRSQELTNYSNDAANSPPQQLSAAVTFEITPLQITTLQPTPLQSKQAAPPAPAKASPLRHAPPASATQQASAIADRPAVVAAPAMTQPVAHAPTTPRSRFTELISTNRELSFWVLLSAALIAAALGALHALEPGHGKTMVAAYLVGSRGTPTHAVLLGIVVTAAHTAGVYLLGIVTLYASKYIVPAQLYPWLGAISGLSVAGLGAFIFLRHLTGESGEHSHATGESHSHWLLQTLGKNPGEPANPAPGKPLSLRQLCLLGITGGMVPCPAALVVLLSAFSLHRVGFGLFLITAFSVGLAAVLVVIGLTMVWAKRAMSTRLNGDNALVRYLPYASSAFMVLVGTGIAASAIAPVQGWPQLLSHLFAKDKVVPFVTVTVLGLLLGMRHSTDPDHVVAVSTIVSRQKSIRGSAAIGLLWGLGHTITIFIVGSAIIVFGIVIPPRLGLSMEFCVALMLILLGGLNLSGFAGRIAERAAGKIDRNDGGAPIMRWMPESLQSLGLYQTLRPVAIGLVHGLAGSAAVALLVLSTIRNPLWSTVYLLVFGSGTMAGMMLMTATMSMPMVYAGKRSHKFSKSLIAISGVASMAFGLFLVYQIGFVDGLFKMQAHWTPQ